MADLAIVLEDLEVCNLDQPGVFCAAYRHAVSAHLDRLSENPDHRLRVADALRNRASAHLAVPMIEAWMFGEPAALLRAGLPAARTPTLRGSDPEDFWADDAAYAADDGSACENWLAKGSPKSPRPPWITDQRERHPKGYLAWLCRHPKPGDCTSYNATDGGVKALRALDWQAVLTRPDSFRFVRALVDDLAEALGPPSVPLPPGPGAVPTRREPGHPERVLRNL